MMPLFLNFFEFMSVHWRSLAVETLVFSPFSVSLTLRSGQGDPSLFHLLRPGLRTSCRAEPELICPPNENSGGIVPERPFPPLHFFMLNQLLALLPLTGDCFNRH
jgi:hypothetical protein